MDNWRGLFQHFRCLISDINQLVFFVFVCPVSIVCLINQFGDCVYFAFDTNPRPPPAAAAIQIPIFRAVDQQIRSSPNDEEEEEEYYEDDIVNKEK